MDPKTLRYSKEHEWIAMDGEIGTIGITDHAQQELGDIVFVELPEVGREVGANEEIGTIESVKAVSEMYSPVAGTVHEINESLADQPETINSDPYGDGWILKMRLADPAELGGLMSAEEYDSFAKED